MALESREGTRASRGVDLYVQKEGRKRLEVKRLEEEVVADLGWWQRLSSSDPAILIVLFQVS